MFMYIWDITWLRIQVKMYIELTWVHLIPLVHPSWHFRKWKRTNRYHKAWVSATQKEDTSGWDLALHHWKPPWEEVIMANMAVSRYHAVCTCFFYVPKRNGITAVSCLVLSSRTFLGDAWFRSTPTVKKNRFAIKPGFSVFVWLQDQGWLISSSSSTTQLILLNLRGHYITRPIHSNDIFWQVQ